MTSPQPPQPPQQPQPPQPPQQYAGPPYPPQQQYPGAPYAPQQQYPGAPYPPQQQYPGAPYPPQQQFAPQRPPASAGRVIDITASIILLILGALVLVPLGFIGLMMGLMTDSCYGSCSMGLISIGQMIALFGPLVLFVCTIVMTVRFINRRRLAWWVPIAGIVGSIVLFLIGNGIATSGLP